MPSLANPHALPDLFELLTLEQLDVNLFRSSVHQENHRGNLFGGQVLGQALHAASRTLNDNTRLPHSCHAYFIRPGSSATPVIYDVEVLRTGNSFSTVRVLARQAGNTIFSMGVSFHKQESGYEHQTDINLATVPKPDTLPSVKDYLASTGHGIPNWEEDPYFELRTVTPEVYTSATREDVEGMFWLKARQKLPSNQQLQRAALAFASDLGLIATCSLPHPVSLFDDGIMAASLDHAIWFHRDISCDDWLLYKTDSPWAGAARGLSRGSLYNMAGELVASTVQEGLFRPIK